MSNTIGGNVGNRQLNPAQMMSFGSVNKTALAQNAKLIESTLNLVEKAVNLATKFVDQMSKASDSQGIAAGPGGCFPSEKPNPLDSVREQNSLKVDDNGKITTPGGYQIEQLGQFEWKVTGPDGKNTRVWGDPHVAEGDGGTFDFKRDSAFVLGDGTRINVTTKPYGNGMTVTGQLDIVSGDSHVRVTDIDKGKGKVGKPTQDGLDEVVRFHSNPKADVFRMGNETDDWTFDGKEIIGSEQGGDVIKTAKDPFTFKPGQNTATQNHTTPTTTKKQPAWADLSKLSDTFNAISKLFDQLKNTRANGFNPFRKTDDMFGKYDRGQHRSAMTQSFKAMGDMFRALEQVSKLNDMVRFRGTQMF
jgi:hypothetical protein